MADSSEDYAAAHALEFKAILPPQPKIVTFKTKGVSFRGRYWGCPISCYQGSSLFAVVPVLERY